MKTKILFVDDEPNVLAGLRRMLRGQRKMWDMMFACGGSEALEMLSQQRVDVIVSDMRMPGIDGAELLQRVSKEYPNTVRIVLSGQSEHEKIFRAVGPAHQYMSKPCDPTLLVETIVRACGLQSQLGSPQLINLTSRLTALPSLPHIYVELLEELESDDASIERIGNKIGSDVAMTARILQLVNSSFFGLPQKVSSASHAVSLLGLNIIRPLALTANTFTQFSEPDIAGFDLNQLTQHSLAVATTARRIAESESNDAQTVDDAFTAGMLHDIGKLVLATNLSSEYAEAIDLATREKKPLWKAETCVFGASHAEVGAHLLGLWGLPVPIVEAVALHHRPTAASDRRFCPLTAVYAAEILQSSGGNANAITEQRPWDTGYIESIGLTSRLGQWETIGQATEV